MLSSRLSVRGIPAIVAAGQETVPHKAPDALAELPPANLNALTLLLELWHRVAENSTANGMDAMAIAVAVAPCLAWNPPAGKEARKVRPKELIECGPQVTTQRKSMGPIGSVEESRPLYQVSVL